MLGNLARHTAVYGLGAVATSGISFLLLPLYARCLSPSAYGQLEALNALGQILLIAFAAGLGSSYFGVHFRLCRSGPERDRLTVTALYCLLASAGLQAGLAVLISPWLAATLAVPAAWVQMVIIAQAAAAVGLLPFAFLRSRSRPLPFVALTLAQLSLLLGLNLYHVAALGLGVPGVLRSQLIVHGLTASAVVVAFLWRFGGRTDGRHARQLIGWGWRHLPNSLASWVTNLSDRYFLLLLSGPALMGTYAMGYKFGMILQVLWVMPLTTAWPPFLHANAERPDCAVIFRRAFRWVVIGACGLWVALGVSAQPLVSWIAGPAYLTAAGVTPIVLLAYVIASLTPVLASGIAVKQAYNWKILIGLATAIGNLGLNLLLIPVAGPIGAAWATVLTFALNAGITLAIAHRLMPIPFAFGGALRLLLFSGLIVTLANGAGVSPWVRLLLVLAYGPAVRWSGLARPWPTCRRVAGLLAGRPV